MLPAKATVQALIGYRRRFAREGRMPLTTEKADQRPEDQLLSTKLVNMIRELSWLGAVGYLAMTICEGPPGFNSMETAFEKQGRT
jgi:hypothetical protein